MYYTYMGNYCILCVLLSLKKKIGMNEKLIEKKLRESVKKMGGIAVKFASSYHRGIPDRIVLMPGGEISFVELKSTGKKPTTLQRKAIEELTGLGFRVEVIDDQEGLKQFLNSLKNGI